MFCGQKLEPILLSVFFPNESSEHPSMEKTTPDEFADMKMLSRKTMSKIWDNPEDEFWNTL